MSRCAVYAWDAPSRSWSLESEHDDYESGRRRREAICSNTRAAAILTLADGQRAPSRPAAGAQLFLEPGYRLPDAAR